MAAPLRKGDESLPNPQSQIDAPRGAGVPVRRAAPTGEPSPVHVSRMLWILLGFATLFLVSVQVFIGRGGFTKEIPAEEMAEVSVLGVISPVLPVRASDLRLSWDSVPGAVQYQLRIHTLQGTPVVDPMIVWGEQWRPSAQLLPGLTPGPYRWTVAAVDGAGRELARSLPTDLDVR